MARQSNEPSAFNSTRLCRMRPACYGYRLGGYFLCAHTNLACSQVSQDGGYQLTSLRTVYGLMVQVVEHSDVLGYLVRPGDLDCCGGGF